MNDALSEFQMLRARIEGAVKPPFALVVTSATDRDGRGVCAQGIAESMAGAGYRTLLVDLDHARPLFDGLAQPAELGRLSTEDLERVMVTDLKSTLSALSLANAALCATGSREDVAAFLALARSRFDAIVVHAPRLATSSLAALFAGEGDAVLATAHEGRSVQRADRDLVELIDRESLHLLGIVTVSRRAIANFEPQTFASQHHRPAAAAAAAIKYKAVR